MFVAARRLFCYSVVNQFTQRGVSKVRNNISLSNLKEKGESNTPSINKIKSLSPHDVATYIDYLNRLKSHTPAIPHTNLFSRIFWRRTISPLPKEKANDLTSRIAFINRIHHRISSPFILKMSLSLVNC